MTDTDARLDRILAAPQGPTCGDEAADRYERETERNHP